MLDFDVQRCTRRCAKTERELQPGETFYSVLVTEGSNVVRRDYAAEAWEGPPEENVVGWWKSQMPDASNKKMEWAPDEVMLDYFEQLEGQPDKADMRYVLALLLVRRRIARLEDTETDEAGVEHLVLHCLTNKNEYRTPVVDPSRERAQEIQEELARLLYAPDS